MMEIDMHSPVPSFRMAPTTRSVSAKRARSPDSPSERPAKRLSLATGGPLSYADNAGYFDARHSASSSRQSSEDWVKQTGGLSIDSPLFAPPGAAVPQLACTADEGMAVDGHNGVEFAPISRRPYLPPLQTQPDTFMSTVPLMNAQEQHSHHQPGPPYTTTPPTTSLSVPAINVLPATPELLSSNPSSISVHEHATPMSMSPTAMYPMMGSPTKRQRFMMGPRANCEKCRLGVKGHWAHLD